MKISLPYIEVTQKELTFYVVKIDSNLLTKLSKSDVRRIENNKITGYQRNLNPDKINSIRNYLKFKNATFPNSIVVHAKKKDIHINEQENILEFDESPNLFSFIDGQHRSVSLEDIDDQFELIVSIFVGLPEHLKSNIFYTINTTQVSALPSLKWHLRLDDDKKTPEKFIVEIAQLLNFDRTSPWRNQINMLDEKNAGILNLVAFCNTLIKLVYKTNEEFDIRIQLDEGVNLKNLKTTFEKDDYILWNFYTDYDVTAVYKILKNYFTAMSKILKKDWCSHEHILCKTTGFTAMVLLFELLFKIGVQKQDLTLSFFERILKPLKRYNGEIKSLNYDSSGSKSGIKLYREFKRIINI